MCFLRCSKGTYVRTWANELGKVLGTGARVNTLCREESMPFYLKDSIDLYDLEEADLSKRNDFFVPFDEILPHLQTFTVSGKGLRLLSNGQIPFDLQSRLIPLEREVYQSGRPEWIKIYNDEGQFLSLVEIAKGKGAKIKRVFKS